MKLSNWLILGVVLALGASMIVGLQACGKSDDANKTTFYGAAN